jgi:Plasmid stabilization system protein
MRYGIRILDLAREDLAVIAAYLTGFSAQAADGFLDAFAREMALIGEHPGICLVYPWDRKYRRAIIGKYLVFYRVDEESGIVSVHRVLHGSRNIVGELAKMKQDGNSHTPLVNEY